MSEPRETQIKRLRMRSWRRGIKEMDLILGSFADAGAAGLGGLDGSELAIYDEMLSENDHDLYAWVSGQSEAPEKYRALLKRIVETKSPA